MAVPVVGTDICGLPRDGVSVSLSGSQVQTDGWRLKSVNHSHAVSISGSTRMSARVLAFKSHLHRAVLTQQLLGGARLFGRALDPDSVIAVTETRIVADHHRQSGNARIDEESGHGRQPADQHHHLESENRVRDPRGDWLAAHYERPVIRYPNRDPVSEG